MNKYQHFYQRMIDGKLPYNHNFYLLDNKDEQKYNDNNKVTIISPVQSSVEKAKSELKEKNKSIKSKNSLTLNQSGGSSPKETN